MMGAGRQGSEIIVSGGASLSLTGEPAQRSVWSAFLVGLLAYTLEIGLIITPTAFGLTDAGPVKLRKMQTAASAQIPLTRRREAD